MMILRFGWKEWFQTLPQLGQFLIFIIVALTILYRLVGPFIMYYIIDILTVNMK